MNYELRISKPALKFLEKHPMEKKKFLEIFKEMSDNYEDAVNKYDIKQMQGVSAETYRLRLGKYRAIYRLYNDVLVIFVLDIGSRGDIYKRKSSKVLD